MSDFPGSSSFSVRICTFFVSRHGKLNVIGFLSSCSDRGRHFRHWDVRMHKSFLFYRLNAVISSEYRWQIDSFKKKKKSLQLELVYIFDLFSWVKCVVSIRLYWKGRKKLTFLFFLVCLCLRWSTSTSIIFYHRSQHWPAFLALCTIVAD